MYEQVLGDYDSCKKHALLTLSYGDSSIAGYVFMLLYDPNKENNNENGAAVAEMENIIKAKYKGEDKTKALEYLKMLSSFAKENWKIAKVITYNLNEILKIIRQYEIKIILMHYPIFIYEIRDAIDKKTHLFKVPLVDNYALFEKRLKDAKIKREDLFAKDGHCNALGYGIIAENVYKTLIQYKIIDDVTGKQSAN